VAESFIANDRQAKAGFWESAERGALEAPYCTACSQFFFFPRPFCPNCWSEAVTFRPVSGFGTIWSYTIVRFAHGGLSSGVRQLPFAMALVTLDEGIRLMGDIVDYPLENIRSGMRVRLAYQQIGERTLPVFTPCE
jgi:uncharacterized OB-fold protein